jgi:hypothetical protein
MVSGALAKEKDIAFTVSYSAQSLKELSVAFSFVLAQFLMFF